MQQASIVPSVIYNIMKATLVAVLLAALAEGAAVDGSAGPPRRHQAPKPGGKTFTINQIVNKNFKGPDGPLSYMSAYLKFAEKLPAELLSALEDDPDLRIKFGAFLQGMLFFHGSCRPR